MARSESHAPGFPSAARFVAQAFMGADLDNRSLPGVYVAVVMGRNAGFLTAASAAARTVEGDGLHLIYLPERIFDKRKFLPEVKSVHERFGRCVIALSEGIANMASSLFGGISVTGTIARTATNVRAGASSPVAGMLHSVFLLVFMLVAALLARFIPLAALAGVLVVVCWTWRKSGSFRTCYAAGAGPRC